MDALAARVTDDGGHVLYQWAAEAVALQARAEQLARRQLEAAAADLGRTSTAARAARSYGDRG